MAVEIGLIQRNCHFGLNLRLSETAILIIRYQIAKYPPKNFRATALYQSLF